MAVTKTTKKQDDSVRATTVSELKAMGWTVEDRPMTQGEFLSDQKSKILLQPNDINLRHYMTLVERIFRTAGFQDQFEKDYKAYETRHSKPE